MTTTDGRYRIAEVAQRTGFFTPALRYYEERGLFPAQRTAGGYRLHDANELRSTARVLESAPLDGPATTPAGACADPLTL